MTHAPIPGPRDHPLASTGTASGTVRPPVPGTIVQPRVRYRYGPARLGKTYIIKSNVIFWLRLSRVKKPLREDAASCEDMGAGPSVQLVVNEHYQPVAVLVSPPSCQGMSALMPLQAPGVMAPTMRALGPGSSDRHQGRRGSQVHWLCWQLLL